MNPKDVMKPIDVMAAMANAAINNSVKYTPQEIIEMRNGAYCVSQLPGYRHFLTSKSLGLTREEVKEMVDLAPTVLIASEMTLELLRKKH